MVTTALTAPTDGCPHTRPGSRATAPLRDSAAGHTDSHTCRVGWDNGACIPSTSTTAPPNTDIPKSTWMHTCNRLCVHSHAHSVSQAPPFIIFPLCLNMLSPTALHPAPPPHSILPPFFTCHSFCAVRVCVRVITPVLIPAFLQSTQILGQRRLVQVHGQKDHAEK